MASEYVPAWKRLGLKLKSQSGSISPSPSTRDAGITPRKRKFENEPEQTIESLSKKKAKKHSLPNGRLNGAHDTNGVTETTRPKKSDDAPSKRKSVRFSPDTKEEDGNSSKRLVQEAFANRLARMTGADASDITAAANTLNNTSDPTENLQSGTKPSDKSNEPRKKASKQPSAKVEAAQQKKKRAIALQYLEEYEKSRATWKFNKIKQNALLKALFDVNAISQDHDQALKEYISGLQGRTIRERLRAGANAVVTAGDDTGDAAKIARARLALDALGADDVMEAEPDTRSEEEAMPRREAVVVSPTVKPDNEIMNGTKKPMPVVSNGTVGNNSKPRKRKRKGKQRNARSDSESSDSSSDDSD